jgi:hypothetical protein
MGQSFTRHQGLWLYSVPEGVRSWSAFSVDISLCNLLLWLSFGLLSVISSRDELYLVPSILIDHGNESSFQGMLLIYYRVTLNHAYFCWISGCEQPSNMSQIITDTKSPYLVCFISYDLRVWAPEWEEKYSYILLSWPKEPDLWPHVLGSEGHSSKVSFCHIPSMHRTTIVALRSMGCSCLSPFSCLVVNKLPPVLLLSWYKVPPMGTLVCHDHLALTARLNLPPRKIMDELDYYGSFIDFAGIA